VNIYTGAARSITYPLTETITTTPFYFTISGDKFDAGDNKVWLEYSADGSDYSTNTVTFTLVSASETAQTPIFSTGNVWLDLFFQPWILGSIIVAVLAGVGDVKMNAKGAVFMGGIIFGAIILTGLGIMPIFVGIGLVLLEAMVFIYFLKTGFFQK
jgi:hypothetical protein